MARHKQMFTTAWWSVRFYYAVTLFFAYNEALPLWDLANSGATLRPQWLVTWMPNAFVGGSIVISAYLATALFAMLFPQYRLARIAVFVAMVEAVGFRYSFGAINHGSHYWLWVGLCFALLPSGGLDAISRTLSSRHRYLVVYWSALALIGLFYSLSGFWKIAAGIEAALAGEINSFSPAALATIVADKMQQTGESTMLGPFLVRHSWVGWPAHLWVIYIELFAIVAVFRPSLHRVWGLMLILFHIGTFLLMDIAFAKHVLLLTILFVWSPFAPPFDWRRSLSVTPIFAGLFRLRSDRRLEEVRT